MKKRSTNRILRFGAIGMRGYNPLGGYPSAQDVPPQQAATEQVPSWPWTNAIPSQLGGSIRGIGIVLALLSIFHFSPVDLHRWIIRRSRVEW